MARMQTREHQMVLVIKELEKSRLDAENTLQDQDAEMKKYISRFSDLTYTIENMEQIIKYLSDYLKHSEKQMKILKKNLEENIQLIRILNTSNYIQKKEKNFFFENSRYVSLKQKTLVTALKNMETKINNLFQQMTLLFSQLQNSQKNADKWYSEASKKNKFVEDWREHAERLKRELNSKEKIASDQLLRDKDIHRQMYILRRQQEMEQERFASLSVEIDYVRKNAANLVEDRQLLLNQLSQTEENLAVNKKQMELDRKRIIQLDDTIKKRKATFCNIFHKFIII
jgi:chromosome segregation ATPase